MFDKVKVIDDVLASYKDVLGNDMVPYKNHVYRIYNLALMLDTDEGNIEKHAIASVFHDIGIWTHNTFDYLEPSRELALTYLESIGRKDWSEEVDLMIEMHHKVSAYKGEYEDIVEAFRKADWIDVSLGLMHFGVKRSYLSSLKNIFPLKGFHLFLVRKTWQELLRSPLRPLPMFKR